MPWTRLPDKVMSTQLLAIMQKQCDGSITVDILCPIWFFLVNEDERIHDTSDQAEIGRRSFVVSEECFGNAFLWFENVSLPNKLLSCIHFFIHYLLPAYTLNDGMPYIVDIVPPINSFEG